MKHNKKTGNSEIPFTVRSKVTSSAPTEFSAKTRTCPAMLNFELEITNRLSPFRDSSLTSAMLEAGASPINHVTRGFGTPSTLTSIEIFDPAFDVTPLDSLSS